MSEVLSLHHPEVQGQPSAAPPPAEGASAEPSWFLVWHSGTRALLVSDAGQVMISPHPGHPFTC